MIVFNIKVIEKSIHHQTQDYLQRNELFCLYNQVLGQVIPQVRVFSVKSHDLNGPENGKYTGMILIDLQKLCDALYQSFIR